MKITAATTPDSGNDNRRAGVIQQNRKQRPKTYAQQCHEKGRTLHRITRTRSVDAAFRLP
jgi:hypothetical protein